MIHVHSVSKSFGPLRVLSDVTLRIDAGERVAFVGSNGSGKTTLLRAILGLVRVSGAVTIDGVDVARDPVHALRRVAYIPQIAPPIEAPVREVVVASSTLRGVSEERVAECAARLGLSLSSCDRSRFRDLSGGMKQKLLAAMALASDAAVMICDEPTANLDASARSRFFDEMRKRAADRTVILCSHRADEVRKLVTRVIELRDGKVLRELGTVSAIESRPDDGRERVS